MSVKIFFPPSQTNFVTIGKQLKRDLKHADVEIQLDFKDYGGVPLNKLDRYIRARAAVIDQMGDATGFDTDSGLA